MAKVIFKFCIEAFYILEMAGEEHAYHHIKVIAGTNAEDIAAHIQILQRIGYIEKFIAESGKFCFTVYGEQNRFDLAFLQDFSRANQSLIDTGAADDNGGMTGIRDQCGTKLTVQGVMGHSGLFHLQEVIYGHLCE